MPCENLWHRLKPTHYAQCPLEICGTVWYQKIYQYTLGICGIVRFKKNMRALVEFVAPFDCKILLSVPCGHLSKVWCQKILISNLRELWHRSVPKNYYECPVGICGTVWCLKVFVCALLKFVAPFGVKNYNRRPVEICCTVWCQNIIFSAL